jgi:hypothetical protein
MQVIVTNFDMQIYTIETKSLRAGDRLGPPAKLRSSGEHAEVPTDAREG